MAVAVPYSRAADVECKIIGKVCSFSRYPVEEADVVAKGYCTRSPSNVAGDNSGGGPGADSGRLGPLSLARSTGTGET